jgi:CRISPR-associated DxTHG motif protein
MKVISFLGTAGYKTTTYVWGDREHATQFFPAAVAHMLKPDKLLICATPTVQQHKNLGELTGQLDAARVAWQVVPIPEGHSETDLWAIFDALTAAVDQGETVTFDVTHSFRSLPILAFLAVAYLKVAKQVKVERVLYGAWEARDDATNRSPVFDLTPFVSLLDWLTATDQFVQTGDARRLAGLLDPQGKGKGAAAQASRKLSEVSLAAFLCQPFTLMREARALDQVLQDAEPELAQMARPFGVLREQITGTFGAFSADSRDAPASLRAQFRLIEWYYANNQLIQAMTLAREWLISAVTYRLGQPIVLNLSARQVMEWAISGLPRVGREMTDEESGEKHVYTVSELNEYGRRIYDTWSERDDLIVLWNALSPVRNAFDHAEHQAGAMRLDRIVRKANEEVMPRLRALAQQWELI